MAGFVELQRDLVRNPSPKILDHVVKRLGDVLKLDVQTPLVERYHPRNVGQQSSEVR